MAEQTLFTMLDATDAAHAQALKTHAIIEANASAQHESTMNVLLAAAQQSTQACWSSLAAALAMKQRISNAVDAHEAVQAAEQQAADARAALSRVLHLQDVSLVRSETTGTAAVSCT